MKTLGELAEALSRMDTLAHRLDDAHTRLSTLMLPDRRQQLLQQEQQWKEEYDQLYNTLLLPEELGTESNAAKSTEDEKLGLTPTETPA
jgi:hypothetical protein